MKKSEGSAPAPPDPAKTAAAQGQLNADAARLQAQLNRINQVTPWGSLTYSGGTPGMSREDFVNQKIAEHRAAFDRGEGVGQQWAEMPAEGGGVTRRFDETWLRNHFATQPIPTVPGQDEWTQNVTLSPEQQRLFETGQTASQSLADLGVRQIGRLDDVLSRPINLGNEATEARLFGLGRARLDPVFAERQAALETQLANQGLARGGEAWNREMRRLTEGQNDALNQLLLSGRGQAVQEGLLERNQPINEISALLSGTQIGMPQFAGVPQVGVQPADITSPTMAAYQGQLANWQNQQQSRNAGLGSLFGLGGSLLGGWASGGFVNPFG